MHARNVTSKARDLLDGIAHVYTDVYTRDPYLETSKDVWKFQQSWALRTQMPGFKLVVVEDSDKIVGMAYGWLSVPGSHWHMNLQNQLGMRAEKWLEDCFEFVDIAVLNSHQGRGLGKVLYNTLFENIPQKTAILYTHQSDSSAYEMYSKLGWSVLRSEITAYSGKPFYLMGKEI